MEQVKRVNVRGAIFPLIAVAFAVLLIGVVFQLQREQSQAVITHTYTCATHDGHMVYNMSDEHGVLSAFKETSTGSVKISNERASINALHAVHLGQSGAVMGDWRMLRDLYYVGVCKREEARGH